MGNPEENVNEDIAEHLRNLKSVLPGTTVPIDDAHRQEEFSDDRLITAEPTSSFDGPVIDKRATTVYIFEPSRLENSRLLSSLKTLINAAFLESHSASKILAASGRLQTEKQFIDTIGHDRGSLTYLVTYAGSDEVIGTLSAHRYKAPVFVAEANPDRQRQGEIVFARMRAPGGDETETWEFKLMAVDPKLQGRGLASYLLALAEEEVKRRFKANVEASSRVATGNDAGATWPAKQKLIFMLTTVKEIRGSFYARRGWVLHYENWNPAGTMGSENGFTVAHFLKEPEQS